jgi:hypothetical protein
MGNPTIWDKLREWIGGIAWDVFIWSLRMTEDQYLDAIYRQESAIREGEKE